MVEYFQNNMEFRKTFFVYSIAFYAVISNFYNHWLNHIFYSNNYNSFEEKVGIFLNSPRIIILSFVSILTTYLIFFDKRVSSRYKVVCILFGLSFIYIVSVPLDVSTFHFLRFLILLGIGKYITVIFVEWIINGESNNFIKNSFLIFYSFVILFILLEIVTMNIKMRTFNGQAYVTRNWKNKYYHKNELGYRDIKFLNDKGKKNLMVLGDSYVEGAGIEYPQDRFSDIIRSELGDKYNVYNLGVSGAHSRNELDSLKTFPVKPNILIFTYYANDIEYLKMDKEDLQEMQSDATSFIQNITKYSYFVNFLGLYWDIYSFSGNYKEVLKYRFESDIIWAQHKLDLQEYITFCKKNDTELYVVVLPLVQDVKGSKFYTDKVLNVFSQEKIECVDVGELIRNEKTSEMVVNQFDAHLSEKGNLILANELLMRLNNGSSF